MAGWYFKETFKSASCFIVSPGFPTLEGTIPEAHNGASATE